MRDALIIFAREPRHGEVKQRLAHDIGPDRALGVYQRLLDRTLRLGRSFTRRDRDVSLWISADNPSPDGRLARFCERCESVLHVQQGADLGERMSRSIADCRRAGAHRIVLVGADCPRFTIGDIRSAFESLKQNDIVIAPTIDGGYGLIGNTQDCPEIFHAMPWGTVRVAELTRQAALQAGRRIAELRVQADIDYLADWQAWQADRALLGLNEHNWQGE